MATNKKAGERKRRAKCAAFCVCWRCTARVLGRWLDSLGSQTEAGKWLLFVTITYRTVINPWKRGFPVRCADRPSPEFARHLFGSFIQHLERELSSPIAFVVADQQGDIGGRFHQHGLISGKGLDRYPRRSVEKWLGTNAGFNRVLPFRKGAAYYISCYIGRNLDKAEWDVDLGKTSLAQPTKGGAVVRASSAELPQSYYHQSLRSYQRDKNWRSDEQNHT